jgi:group II intron reverse transcriptase/maturase
MLLYVLNGDYLNRNASNGYEAVRFLNIRHGNGAFVVVGARESLVHGEGKQLIFLIQLMENVRDIMRNPSSVLNSLSEHSKNSCYKYERLYRILFNKEMYYVAYQNIYAKEGNMTPGVNNVTIDGMSLIRIEQLIEAIRNESYQPAPSRRTYIPKKNGKKRPLGIQSFNDKLLQEVIRMILEAIFEKQFDNSSHGFRPNRSCHTALVSMQKTFTGTKWFVEGDIKGFFDNINHNVLINILGERIADSRFLRLIRKLLNAGYLEDWQYHNTFSGTPQGGIASPILANIYLDKLDKYMREYIQRFDKGKEKKVSRESATLKLRTDRISKKLKTEKDQNVKERLLGKHKTIRKQRMQIKYSDDMDENFKRLKYVRYADDFLIGIIGSKDDCRKVKEDIKQYLYNTLKLELSDEKTLITNAKNPAKFLGFDVSVRQSNQSKRNKDGVNMRVYSSKVVLSITNETMKKKLLEYDAMTTVHHNGREIWKCKSRPCMRHNDDLEIIDQYNAEIRGLYNYYAIANNSYTLDSFYNIMEYSMYKTYACKYRTTKRNIIRRFSKDKEFIVPYTNKKGKVLYRQFYNDGFKRKSMSNTMFSDQLPQTVKIAGRTSLMDRLEAKQCEYCGATDNLQMHHVRKLKELKGKELWEKHMIARNRKTFAVCIKCHKTIHNGTMD